MYMYMRKGCYHGGSRESRARIRGWMSTSAPRSESNYYRIRRGDTVSGVLLPSKFFFRRGGRDDTR